MACDVGCVTGQLTQLLATKFETVIGVDSSETQIAHVLPCANVRYQCAATECFDVPDNQVDLITAVQGVHWFDLPQFYRQVQRVLTQKGIITLISYGVLSLEAELNDRFQHLYWNEIRPFWPPECQWIDSGYLSIDFPFSELNPPAITIRLDWNLPQFIGYLSTWSAVHHAREQGREDMLQCFAHDIANLWGDAHTRHVMAWEITMRIGTIVKSRLY